MKIEEELEGTELSLGLIIRGTGIDILKLKSNIEMMLNGSLRLVYQRTSMGNIYISNYDPNSKRK